jgi:hypothetical protein
MRYLVRGGCLSAEVRIGRCRFNADSLSLSGVFVRPAALSTALPRFGHVLVTFGGRGIDCARSIPWASMGDGSSSVQIDYLVTWG